MSVRGVVKRLSTLATSVILVSAAVSTAAFASESAPAAVPACSTSSLRLILGPVGGARGHGYAVYDLTNASRGTCSLDGFPRIGLLRPDGRPIEVRTTTTTRHGTVSPAVSARRVRLGPGSTASFWMEWADRAGRLRGSLRVTPPGQRRAIEIRNRYVDLDVGKVTVSPVTTRMLTR